MEPPTRPGREGGRRRAFTACASRVLLLAATMAMATSTRVHAQALDRSTEMLLRASDAALVLGSVREEVGQALDALGVVPTPAQADVLERFFAPDSLMRTLGHELESLGGAEIRAAAALLLEAGAIARVDSAGQARPPSTTLEEYVAGLEQRTPTQARIQLMNQVVAAQAAGPAQVLLAERIREAGHRIARTTGTEVEPFEPLTQAGWVGRAEEAHNETLIAFLHRYENVPDELLEARVQAWITDAGAWFSEAYSVALAETVLVAADAAAAALRGG